MTYYLFKEIGDYYTYTCLMGTTQDKEFADFAAENGFVVKTQENISDCFENGYMLDEYKKKFEAKRQRPAEIREELAALQEELAKLEGDN